MRGTMTPAALWRTCTIVALFMWCWLICMVVAYLVATVSAAYWWAAIPGAILIGLAHFRFYPALAETLQREELFLAMLITVLLISSAYRLDDMYGLIP